MIYLKKFNFASFNNDLDFCTGLDCYNTKYPFGILSYHRIEKIEFEPITIFYGGNGCGKTTALNIIAEKLKVQRDTLYNKSNFFDNYLSYCRCDKSNIPRNSRIITSDDVFEFTMNLRYLNEGINRQRQEISAEYDKLKAGQFKLKSLKDYDEFKRTSITKKINKSNYILQKMQNNVREHSNGESAFIYFTDKIEENALYLLDEPENSLSPEKQQELLQFIEDSVRFYNCQFIIATHSPFILSLKDAKIYDFDENPVCIKKWTELKNVLDYYNFFKSHEDEFIHTQKEVCSDRYTKPSEIGTLRKYLIRDNYCDLGKDVFDKLRPLLDGDDFFINIMSNLDNKEKLQKMLDYLKKTGTSDPENIVRFMKRLDMGLV